MNAKLKNKWREINRKKRKKNPFLFIFYLFFAFFAVSYFSFIPSIASIPVNLFSYEELPLIERERAITRLLIRRVIPIINNRFVVEERLFILIQHWIGSNIFWNFGTLFWWGRVVPVKTLRLAQIIEDLRRCSQVMQLLQLFVRKIVNTLCAP